MLVGRLGDSLFAMPAPHGHGSTGIAEPGMGDYPLNIDGCLGDEVRRSDRHLDAAVADPHVPGALMAASVPAPWCLRWL